MDGPKEGFVSWGHPDIESHDFRGDAPSLSLDSMKTIFTLAAEFMWTVCKMFIKSAYLRAKDLFRDIFIWPLRKGDEKKGLLRFLVPVYVFTDPGHLGYLATYEPLNERIGFERSRLDPLMYIRRFKIKQLSIVVRSNDFQYARPLSLEAELENFLQHEFKIGYTEYGICTITGALFFQEKTQTP